MFGLIRSMPYAQWHYPFENKDKLTKTKIFQLILLRKVSIKRVVGFIPTRYWNLSFDKSSL
jgi:hypothetical protein